MFQIKVFYKINELAKMIGRNYWQTRRLLKNMDVPIHQQPVRVVYLSDLREKCPDLLLSLLIKDQAEPLPQEPDAN